ncbi:hypothetical protein Tco_1523756, partial [Tanacetum coccineum]
SVNEGWYISADNVLSYTSGSTGGDVVLDFKDSGLRKRPDSVFSYTSGSSKGEVVLDFKDSTMRKKPRYSQDHTYECLFRQSGSVTTQGESSRAFSGFHNNNGSTMNYVPRCDNAVALVPQGRSAGAYCVEHNSGSGMTPLSKGELLYINLDCAQHFGSTSSSVGPVDYGIRRTPWSSVGGYCPDDSCGFRYAGNMLISTCQNVPQFIGIKRMQTDSDEGFRRSHTVKQRRLARAISASTMGSTDTQVEEIKRHMNLYPKLLPGDRADVVVRVFQARKDNNFAMFFLKDNRLFGTVTGRPEDDPKSNSGVSFGNVGHGPRWTLPISSDRCQSFEDIRTVNNRLYTTFRVACKALGLLGDDKEWDTTLMEACFSSTPSELRNLFVQLLNFCEVSDPLRLWSKYWRRMSDDIPRTTTKSLRISQLHINDPENLLDELRNRELMEEKSYNREELAQEVIHLVSRLNTDQKDIYDRVVNVAATE